MSAGCFIESMLSFSLMSPLVSVITISFNSKEFIASTINSVLRQSFQDFEYLIIDGGSTDGTLKIVESFNDPRIKIISEKDNGISDAMNKGIRAASGKWIGIIHSDDEYVGEAIQDSVTRMQETQSQWSYGQLEYTDRQGQSLYCTGKETAPEEMKHFMSIPHPTVFVSKNLYDQIELFQEDFRVAMDYELCLRLLEKEKPAYVKQVIAKMRHGGASSKDLKAELKGAHEVFLAKTKNKTTPYLSALKYRFWMSLKAYIRYIVRQLPGSKKIASLLRFFSNPSLISKSKNQ